jgi:PAP2 superfamily
MKSDLQTKITALRSEFAPVMREHRCLIWIITIYAALALGMSHRLSGQFDPVSLYQGFGSALFIGPIFALCAYAIYVMVYIRPHQLTRYLISSVRQYMDRARLMRAVPVLLLIPVFISSFTILKAAIPYMHPFAWDGRLAELDATLHGGVHPWVWLQYILTNPWATAVINFAYHLWFFIMYALLYLLTLSTDKPMLRMQFLLSFVIAWILLGTVTATLFSSVGPCYYGFLLQGETNPYAQLMMNLNNANNQVSILAVDVQKLLWTGYRGKDQATALGISAMPSMHVATSVLLALCGWRLNRAMGIALSLFAVIIMVGSVHLGWHYALDGYVGAAGAYAIWRAVGWALSRSSKVSTNESPFAQPQVPYVT